MTTTSSVRVATPTAAYDAVVGTGLTDAIGDHVREAVPTAKAALLVTDFNLADSAKLRAAESLADYRLAQLDLTPTEPDKSIATWQQILDACAAHRLERSDVIVALGGGIIGDTAGFAAASYRRGVNVIQCPTTLLAMVDASVGGKTGVNLDTPQGLLKNFVGAFHHPKRVLADVATLNSLPPWELAAGLAECIKHAMISGPLGQPDLGTFIDDNLERFKQYNHAALADLVTRNITLKAAVVASDEHETSTGTAGRALLNLGHTFAHAIETLPGVTHTRTHEGRAISTTGLLHGEAVALGLVAAATYAVATNQLPQADLDTLLTRLNRAELPTAAAGLPEPATILDRMRDDKKATAGTLRLVVPQANAGSLVTSDIDSKSVLAAIDAIRV